MSDQGNTKQGSLFEEENKDQTTEGKTDQSNTGPLALLVGEGRKYSNPDDLAKAYLSADDFIEKLKDENAKLREQVSSGKTIEDVLEKIEVNRRAAGDTTPIESKGVSAEDISKIVDQAITGRETARTRQSNMDKVDAMMIERFGAKAGDVFRRHANTREKAVALKELASVSPDTFMQLFKEEPFEGNSADGSNSRNDGAIENNTAPNKQDPSTKAYYDEMRKKDPNRYYSAEVQMEMHRKAQSNPEKFLGRRL